uniref:Uncharacterized protein n=1 Tax=Ananas comosus var. bracteatus TaxID=296719 RepID=A0A6V7PSS9_ANACO|nr:unnamed protein product [Ananas comosus var. bracteatus]
MKRNEVVLGASECINEFSWDNKHVGININPNLHRRKSPRRQFESKRAATHEWIQIDANRFSRPASRAKKKGRGPTTNPNAKKRKEEKKGKVEFSKRLGRAVGGLQLAKFITEMGVVLRQYAPLNVNKWAEGPMHYKDKMWDDLMRMSARNKANRAKQSTSSICGRKSFATVLYDMKQFEHVRKSQEELGDPPLSTEEHLTKAFGARSRYLRGLGCGPKPLSSKNLEAKASKEAIERQIEELKNELKQSREENEEREAHLQREKDEREERFKKEIEEIKAHFKAEFNEQLKIIVQLYGAPTTSSPPSTQNH